MIMTRTILNLDLYEKLDDAFDKVVLVNAGERRVESRRRYNPATKKFESSVCTRGEEYRVNCPYCGDKRQRLYINHQHGVFDWSTGYTNRLAFCFNEECQKNHDFHPFLEKYINGNSGAPVKAASGKVASVEVTASQPFEKLPVIELPQGCTPLNELDSDHPSRRFLQNRGFNDEMLAHNYGLCFGQDPQSFQTSCRLIAPIDFMGQWCGYQGRWINPDGTGDMSRVSQCSGCRMITLFDVHEEISSVCSSCGCELKPIVKWLTSPGTSKSKLLFNHDAAAQERFVVVCEGPLDVMRLGNRRYADVRGPGVALLGHEASERQKQLLLANERWRSNGILVVLDQDVSEVSQALAKELADRGAKTAAILLPENKDPGDMTHTNLWDLIAKQAYSEGVSLGN